MERRYRQAGKETGLVSEGLVGGFRRYLKGRAASGAAFKEGQNRTLEGGTSK